jgi:hypothetical protein
VFQRRGCGCNRGLRLGGGEAGGWGKRQLLDGRGAALGGDEDEYGCAGRDEGADSGSRAPAPPAGNCPEGGDEDRDTARDEAEAGGWVIPAVKQREQVVELT